MSEMHTHLQLYLHTCSCTYMRLVSILCLVMPICNLFLFLQGECDFSNVEIKNCSGDQFRVTLVSILGVVL